VLPSYVLVPHWVRLPFRNMPARHLRAQPEQGLAYTPLSVHSNAVARQNGAGQSVGASTAFVPLWLLHVTGDVCYKRLVLSLAYNRSAIDSALPLYRFDRNGTSFLGFYNTLVTTTFFNLAAAYRYTAVYI
jgi:hypothetical protein